ncbi:MAG: TonB-dependent receptor plug domain-containing protein [Candidatus Omnitrophota bacterium]
MRKKNSRYVLLISCMVIACSFPQVTFAQVEEYVSPELLLFEEVPIVYAASKRPQLFTEALSTMEVITAEDIRRSGATTFAELFWTIPGVNVFPLADSYQMIKIRDVRIIDLINGYVFGAIDGNGIYTYHCDSTYWET